MISLVSSRTLAGFSKFGAPPRVLLEFEAGGNADKNTTDLPQRIALLGSCLGRSAESALCDDVVARFADLLELLMARAGCAASVRPRPPKPGDNGFELVVGCEHAAVAEKAAEFALSLLSGPPDALERASVEEWIDRLSRMLDPYRVDADSYLMRQAAADRDLPVRWLDQDPFNPPDEHRAIRYGLLQIGQGVHQRRTIGLVPMPTANHAPVNVLDRQTLMATLTSGGLPVPAQDLDFPNKNSLGRLTRAADRIGYPVVVRPAVRSPFADWTGGVPTVGPIDDAAGLARAFETKAFPGRPFWIEAYSPGEGYRFDIIGGRIRAAMTGTGPQSPNTAPAPVDLNTFSSEILALAESAARAVRLAELAAVEMSIVDRQGPAESANCVITDVFPDPRMVHPDNDSAAKGIDLDKQDPVKKAAVRSAQLQAEALLDVLFPYGAAARIPIVAVTGTNGKTTTTRMLARILRHAFNRVGLATTDGAFVNDDLLDAEEASGVAGAALVLAEPDVEAAVLETARGDLLNRGTAFDTCDVAVCLNVSADHLGRDGIETLDQMAELKGRLLQRATQAVVVNADDPRCLGMLARVDCRRHVLVAESESNPAVRRHLAEGGEAVFDESGPDGRWIILARGEQRERLVEQQRIPATMNAALGFNLINARHAAAAAWAQGVDLAAIRSGLAEFDHSHKINPGRFNLFTGYPFTVMLDFAHNPAGVHGVLELVEKMEIPGKRHLVCLTIGARHKAHMDELAGDLARAFDTFRLGCYKANVEKNPEYTSGSPVEEMLAYFQHHLVAQGVPEETAVCHVDRAEAIRAGLASAGPGDLLVVLGHPDISIPLLAAGPTSGPETGDNKP